MLLATRLRARRPRLDEEVSLRMAEAVPDDQKTDGAEYLSGRHKAVSAALDDLLDTIEEDGGELSRDSLPFAVRSHVRRAAAAEVPLDKVLMRYAAARGALTSLVLREVAEMECETESAIPAQALHSFMSGMEATMALLGAEYRESLVELSLPTADRQRARCIKALLGNEPCDLRGFNYELDRWHLGVIVTGDGAEASLRKPAASAHAELLTLRQSSGQTWAWFGTRHCPQHQELVRRLRDVGPEGVSLVTGEPAMGIEGFRRTHLQAKAAEWVAARRPRPLTRYADVILLSAVIRDPELERSLRDAYLSHFNDPRDTILLDTVRAYFSCGHNISSAAAALNADRGTVGRRIRTVEQRIGRQLRECQPEFEVALRLDCCET